MTDYTHTHSYRAVPGAGWRCTICDRRTVSAPPTELRASYQARVRREAAEAEAFIAAEVAAGRACGDHDRPLPCLECR